MPTLFYKSEKNISVIVHGDDFVALGDAANLDWYESQICNRFEVGDRCRIGRDENDSKETRILNIILRLTQMGCYSRPILDMQNF